MHKKGSIEHTREGVDGSNLDNISISNLSRYQNQHIKSGNLLYPAENNYYPREYQNDMKFKLNGSDLVPSNVISVPRSCYSTNLQDGTGQNIKIARPKTVV